MSLSQTALSRIPGDLPDVLSLTKHGGSAWWTSYFPWSHGIKIENITEKSELKESSTVGHSSKGSKEGSSQGELQCLEDSQGATGQNLGYDALLLVCGSQCFRGMLCLESGNHSPSDIALYPRRHKSNYQKSFVEQQFVILHQYTIFTGDRKKFDICLTVHHWYKWYKHQLDATIMVY